MNLSFDHLHELDDFLRWADAYRAAGAVGYALAAAVSNAPFPGVFTTTITGSVGGAGGGGGGGSAKLVSSEGATGGAVAFDTPPQYSPKVTHISLDDIAPEDGETRVVELPAQGDSDTKAANPAKRKRRTKAEIEADEKAAAAKVGDTHVDVARVVHADGSVTTTSVGLPPDVDPSAVTGLPAGANPFEQVAATGEAAAAETADEPNAEAAGDAVITPFQHLTRAREFIAKHGMPKYNESFSKAGLDANVMGYTAYQRALHMEALDALEKA